MIRPNLYLWVMLALAQLSCQTTDAAPRRGKADRRQNQKMSQKQPPETIERRGANQWFIRAERRHEGRSVTAQVVLRLSEAPDPAHPPHANLVGSRAWLSLGEQRFGAKDWAGAIASARAGLAELGTEYAEPTIVDDTDMKLLAAEERIQQGHLEDGASIMLRMLTTRTRLYAKLHANQIIE